MSLLLKNLEKNKPQLEFLKMDDKTTQETLKLIQESINHINEIYWFLEKDTKFNVDKKVLDDLEDTWCKLEQIIIEFYHRS